MQAVADIVAMDMARNLDGGSTADLLSGSWDSDVAASLARQGDTAGALQEFLWCFDEGMLQLPTFAGVRTSFLLGDLGRLAKVPSDGLPYPIFAFAALVPWTFFATGLSQSSNSLVGSANLLRKVYFPRLAVPTAHRDVVARDHRFPCTRAAILAEQGFDEAALAAFSAALRQMERPTTPFYNQVVVPNPNRPIWVEPGIVVDVEFKEWTHDFHLRAPVYKGIELADPDTVTWAEEGPG